MRDLVVGQRPITPWAPQNFHTSEQVHDLRLTRRFSAPLDDLAPLLTGFGALYGRFFATPRQISYASGDTLKWDIVEDTAGWYDTFFDGPLLTYGQGGTFLLSVRLVSGVANQAVDFVVNNLGFSNVGQGSSPSNGAGVDSADASVTSIRRLTVDDLLNLYVTTNVAFTPLAGFASYFALTQLAYRDW